MQTSHEISFTILKQLHASGSMKVWSWGTHAYREIKDGLQFKVQGHHFKGHIRITYDEGRDLYDISLGHFYKKEWREKKRFEGIYFDEMVDFIDKEIEYIPCYGPN